MSKKRIRKAIFPVAGFGTRFLPITKSQPKEMLPIVDKPVLHYLVEEAVAAGIEEIILVTGRGKGSIEDYFDTSFELEYNLVEKKKHSLLKEVKSIPNLATFIYVRQPVPLGDGHAILCAKNLIGDEPCAVIYGDDIIKSEKSAISQLIEVYEQTGSSVVGLTNVKPDKINKYGIVTGDTEPEANAIKIDQLNEKPAVGSINSTKAAIGKYIITPELMSTLAEIGEGSVGDGEIRLADGIIKALENGQNIYGKMIDGKRYDAGSKIGFLRATIDFALERDDLRDELIEHLRSIEIS